jgi:hypothetical protein
VAAHNSCFRLDTDNGPICDVCCGDGVRLRLVALRSRPVLALQTLSGITLPSRRWYLRRESPLLVAQRNQGYGLMALPL